MNKRGGKESDTYSNIYIYTIVLGSECLIPVFGSVLLFGSLWTKIPPPSRPAKGDGMEMNKRGESNRIYSNVLCIHIYIHIYVYTHTYK